MEEQEFDVFLDLFSHEGWKMFIEDMAKWEEAVTKGAVDSAISNDQWQYCRGQTHLMRWVLGYENAIRLNLEQANSPEEEDDAYLI